MKKIISLLALTAIIAASLFAFASCVVDDGTHKHSLKKVDRVEPTCTLAGIEEYYYCDCGLKFADESGTEEITTLGIIEPLGHTYATEWTIDENGHYYACACGAKSEEGAHTDLQPNKDHKCDVCGYEISKCADSDDADFLCDYCGSDKLHECDFGSEWLHDETKHWHACACGEKSDEADHADADKNHKCDVCAYEIDKCSDGDDADHNCDYCGNEGVSQCQFGETWVTNAEKHWHECACGAKSDETAHADVEVKDHKCDACGYEMSACADGDDADHSCDHCGKEGISDCQFGDAWKYNGEKHWHECACGAKSDESSHLDVEVKDHKCDVCGYEMSECADSADADHKCDYCDKDGITKCQFSETWKTNAEKHWHECACGAKSDEASHRPDRESATEEDPVICLDCGYVIAPELAHTHKFTVVVYDENNHSLKCSGCGEVDPTSVSAHVFSEKTVDSTCTVKGTKTYTCECGFSKEEKLPLADHTAGEPVSEKIVNSTCKTEGSYQEVVYCSACNVELSRVDKTIAVVPHTEEPVLGKAPTCTEPGLKDGVKCSVCGDTLVEQEEIPVVDHTRGEAVNENEVPATCLAGGSYDEVVYCSACSVELDRAHKTTDVADHNYSDILEGPDGFFKECQTEGCDVSMSVAAPLASSYTAVKDNSFTSSKLINSHFVYRTGSAWGITTNGTHKIETAQGSPASGAIGGIDMKGQYVEYEFVLTKPGTVDIIWTVAGSHWTGSTNGGIDDLGKYCTATLDGKAVSLNGIGLPAGSGTAAGTSLWWNHQQIVLKNVALEAGTHTFRFNANTDYYGVNVISFDVNSDKDVGYKSVAVKSVTLEQEDGKIYYKMTMDLGKFTTQADIKFWNEIGGKNTYFSFESFVTDENGLTTAKINMTNQATAHDPIAPHMSVGKTNYVNGSNNKGDLVNVGNNKIAFEKTLIQANGKSYLLYDYWGMPSVLIVSENYIRLTGADLSLEGSKVYYTLTYRVIGYDPSKVQIFDGNTIYATTYTVDEAYNVTYKIDATNLSAIWPHLRLNGTNWDGMNNVKSDNGDVKLTVKEKNVTLDGKTYSLGTEWGMPRMVLK